MVPPSTLETTQPAWVQTAVKHLNSPAAGCVTTTFSPGKIVPPPSGTSAALVSASAGGAAALVSDSDGLAVAVSDGGGLLGVGVDDGSGAVPASLLSPPHAASNGTPTPTTAAPARVWRRVMPAFIMVRPSEPRSGGGDRVPVDLDG